MNEDRWGYAGYNGELFGNTVWFNPSNTVFDGDNEPVRAKIVKVHNHRLIDLELESGLIKEKVPFILINDDPISSDEIKCFCSRFDVRTFMLR